MEATAHPAQLAGVSLADWVFAVVDVETNGLSSRRHRVLQLAIVRARGDGTIVDRWSTLVRPGWARVGRSSRVHGLTRRDLRGAPRFADLVTELAARLDGAVVAGHNVGFDWAFLRRGLRRSGYPVPDATRLCTLRLSRSLDPDRQASHRLVELCERYRVPLGQAHDALADATATASLLPLLLAAAGITSGEQLGPHMRGSTTAWPPSTAAIRRPSRWLSARRPGQR